MNCDNSPVVPPKLVAIATDQYLTPLQKFGDSDLPGAIVPSYGQDITFGIGRKPPQGHDVGKDESDLKAKMKKLLDVFASQDKAGMAKRLFTQFLEKQTKVTYFNDDDLNKAAANHANIKSFCNAALGAPNTQCGGSHHQPLPIPGKMRIHQALRQANWDLKRLIAPTDLGVPAFNLGTDVKKVVRIKDFANGLALMINGVQRVYIVATHYRYDKDSSCYCINLKFMLYDIFGLDDDDLKEFGAKSAGKFSTDAGVGITAWWQLQHQFGYAPVVTRIVLDNSYEVSIPREFRLKR